VSAAEQTFTLSTAVGAGPDTVWERVSTPEGINHELGPWLRMTVPARFRALDAETVPVGERLFRSWILLFGVIPVDYDDLTIVRLEPGRGFLERSRLASARVWEHERTLEAAAGGCRVTDRIAFVPRVPGAGRAQRALLRAVFRRRHRRLVRHFGAAQ
jgi:ligand-binding SRPBCC domain-containing protein